jgi:hypothetical protein
MAIFLSLSWPSARSAQSLPCWSSRPQVRKAFQSLRSVTFGLVSVNFGRRDRHARVEVPDEHLHAVADELVGDRDALLRVRLIVANLDDELLAEHAAGSVDVLDRLIDAVDELRAERSVRTRHRSGDADLDLGFGPSSRQEQHRHRERFRERVFHDNLPSPFDQL